MKATSILETAIYARDIDAAEAFYTRVFGLDVLRKLPGSFVFLRCGAQMLLVFDPEKSSSTPDTNPIPRHGASGAGHVCFRADTDAEIGAWRTHFHACGVALEQEHTWPDGGRSLYLRDPAGNSVEVAEARIWGLTRD